jgi:hypothetical protein
MPADKPTMYVVPRYELAMGRPELFWLDESGNVCGYAFDGHFECPDRGYYLKRTIPADPTNGNMAHMIKQWKALPGGEGVTIKLAKRLRRMATSKPTKPAITLQRACMIEVGTGKPGYRWVQGWAYMQKNGLPSIPARLHDARSMARDDYPDCRIILQQ